MAKRKKSRFGGKLKKYIPTFDWKGVAPLEDRLAILSVELALAATEILKEDHNFDDREAAVFLDKMLDRAKVNREDMLEVQHILEARRKAEK